MSIKLSQLPAGGAWYIFTATADFTGTGLKPARFEKDVRGYIRRSEKDENYFAVMAKTKSGNVVGNWTSYQHAAQFCRIEKIAPAEAEPQFHWEQFWSTRF